MLRTGNRRLPRINNLRVYESVKLVDVMSEGESIGVELHFDLENKLVDVNWEYSMRFVKGKLRCSTTLFRVATAYLLLPAPGVTPLLPAKPANLQDSDRSSHMKIAVLKLRPWHLDSLNKVIIMR